MKELDVCVCGNCCYQQVVDGGFMGMEEQEEYLVCRVCGTKKQEKRGDGLLGPVDVKSAVQAAKDLGV